MRVTPEAVIQQPPNPSCTADAVQVVFMMAYRMPGHLLEQCKSGEVHDALFEPDMRLLKKCVKAKQKSRQARTASADKAAASLAKPSS